MQDLEHVIQNARSGSVVLLTSDADPKALDKRLPDATRRRMDELFELVMPALDEKEAISRQTERLFKECGVGDVRLRALKKRLDPFVELAAFRHHGGMNCICISPDGKTLYAAGFDRSIRVWPQSRWRRLMLRRESEAKLLF